MAFYYPYQLSSNIMTSVLTSLLYGLSNIMTSSCSSPQASCPSGQRMSHARHHACPLGPHTNTNVLILRDLRPEARGEGQEAIPWLNWPVTRVADDYWLTDWLTTSHGWRLYVFHEVCWLHTILCWLASFHWRVIWWFPSIIIYGKKTSIFHCAFLYIPRNPRHLSIIHDDCIHVLTGTCPGF